MPNESDPEKKVKIRPRWLDEKEKGPAIPKEPVETQEKSPDAKKLKWDNRLRQSGVKFPAKLVSKPVENPAEEAGTKNPEPAISSGRDPEMERPDQPPSKTLQPEGWESSAPALPAPDKEVGDSGGKRPEVRNLVPGIRRRVIKRIRVTHALAAGFAVAVFFSIISWNMGVSEGGKRSIAQETKEKVSAPKEFLAKLNQALADLRDGNTGKATEKLKELEASNAGVASLTYLLAVAAVQNGDIPLAEKKTAESIAKRERISDSLALQAVLETQKGADASVKKFGDTRLRSELLLRQAMLADAANPFPMVELATLLRYQKRDDEALALLRGARSRLNPVDSHSVVDVTIDLTTLQDTPDSQLPQIADPGKNLASAFSAAYVAMRKGDFDRAADIVKTARKMTSADLFYYLINDPAIRRYAAEPKMQEFFR